MKLQLIALAALSAIAGTASAAPAVNVSTATKVYMSGATALRNSISGLAYNDICGGSANASLTVYNMTLGTGTNAPTPNGNQWAIACNLPAAFNGIAAGTPVVLFKSDAGGSAQGVFPVANGESRPMVNATNIANCTPTGTLPANVADKQYNGCPTNNNQIPHFGVSDLEPGFFTGLNVPNDPLDADDDNYPSLGLSADTLATMTIEPVVQTVFGVAVNTALYQAMQAAQISAGTLAASCQNLTTDVCQPSIGKSVAATYFAGFSPDWSYLVGSTGANADGQVNICRRVQGSGTQAAANRYLMEYPTNLQGLTPADFSYSSLAGGSQTSSLWTSAQIDAYINQYVANTPGNTFVFEGPGTGDVVKCLNRAQAVGGYAIGHVSKENAPGANNWRHVKLDGVSPSRDNAKVGNYDYFFESTLQYRTAFVNAQPATVKNYVIGFTAEMKKASALAKLSSTTQQGVLVLPQNWPVGATPTANELTFGSFVTRGGGSPNSNLPVTRVK